MRTFATSIISACLLAYAAVVQAIELDGAWANDLSACTKVFVKQGNRISLSKDSDMYGSGFVIEADRIRGKIATCTIKSRKADGAVLHMVATCSDDVALQSVQFSIKSEGENTITRIFHGLPELDTRYHRCSF